MTKISTSHRITNALRWFFSHPAAYNSKWS
jgi:hypothetical protein